MNLNIVASVVIGPNQVNYCRVVRKSKAPVVDSVALYDFGYDNMDDLDGIMESINSLVAKPTLVNLSIISSDVIKHIYFYRRDAQNVRSNVMRDLKNDYEIKLQDYLIDFEETNLENKKIVFVVAMPKALFEACYEKIKNKGNLKLFALETDVVSLRRLVALSMQPRDGMELCFNFARDHTNIFVMDGTSVLVDREINYGFDEFVKDLASAGGVGEEEIINFLEQKGFSVDEGSSESDMNAYQVLTDVFDKMSIELQRTIDYVISNQKLGAIDGIVTLGSINRIKKADVYLSRLFSMKVEKMETAKKVEFDSAVDFSIVAQMHCFDVAVGAALRKLG